MRSYAALWFSPFLCYPSRAIRSCLCDPPPLPSPSPPSPSLPSSSLPSFVFPVFPVFPSSPPFLFSPVPLLPLPPTSPSARAAAAAEHARARAVQVGGLLRLPVPLQLQNTLELVQYNWAGGLSRRLKRSLYSLPFLPLPPVPVLLQLQNTLELVQYNWAGAGDCALAAELGEAETRGEARGEPGVEAAAAAAAVGGAAELLFPLRGKAAGGVGRAGWAGVACDSQGNPVRMEFPRQGLTGHLPLDVSRLTSLTKMLTSLTNIDLQRNLIIERLDVFIKPLEGLTNLQHLDLSSNFLFGSIQPSITAAFPRLTALLLSSNRLTGRVPSRLPPLLSTLSLSSNYLSGSLPRTSLLCSPASFSLNCFSKQDLYSCFVSRTSQPGSAGPRLGSAVPDLASLVEQQRPEQQCGEALCGGISEGEYCEGKGVCRPMILSPALKYGDVLPWMCACHDGEVGRCGMLKMLFELSTASKAGVLSFHVPLAEEEVVQFLCEGEVTTCAATSAANPVISPASVACVSEEAEAEVERAVAALRAIAEARITVARGMIPLGAGAPLPAAGARPPVVAGAPPPPAAGALPRTGAAEADLPRASAARLPGPRVVTSECSRASSAPFYPLLRPPLRPPRSPFAAFPPVFLSFLFPILPFFPKSFLFLAVNPPAQTSLPSPSHSPSCSPYVPATWI
ncbi:unnamed protein product [Closterium sp. Naga37s-1]|nr:unnamed protein product [Closterium sp. Naga37s-1]